MAFTIPHASGLAQELVSRLGETRLGLSNPLETMCVDQVHKLTTTDVSIDNKKIGTVRTRSYMGPNGVKHISFVEFEGRIPGYVNPSGGETILMIAGEHDETGCYSLPLTGISQPNNTPEKPLFRKDGHQTLRLADYEVDGRRLRLPSMNLMIE